MPKNKTKTAPATKKRSRKTLEKQPARGSRRWIILALVCVLLGSTAGAGYYFTRKKSDTKEVSPEQLATWLNEATQLADNQQYSDVIDRLGPEITSGYRDDPNALRLFAKSRTMVPAPENRHLLDAIRVYRRTIVLDPSDGETAKELFYLYQVIGAGEKAAEMGLMAIEHGAADFDFRLACGSQLRQIRKYEAASAIAKELIAEDPTNLDVYQLQLGCMADQDLTEDEIYQFISDVASDAKPNAPTRDQLLLALAEIQGDTQLISLLTRKVSAEPIGSPKQAVQLAKRLARANQTEASLQVLETASKQTSSEPIEIDLPLLYRYLQDSRFTDVRELVGRKFPDVSKRPEEVTVVESLASWLDNPTNDLTPYLERLRQSETMLSRTWTSLFQQLAANDGNALELVRVTKQAADTYPRSSYLQFFYAAALESLGETEMAIHTYRNAIRLAPRWGVSRVRLAEVLMKRGEYRTAFIEATVALRANTKFGRGFEAVVASSTGLVARGEQLPKEQLATILDALKSLTETTEDTQQKHLLQALTARFENDTESTDNHIRDFMKNTDSLDPTMVRMMRQLATDDQLFDSIGKTAEKSLGLTLGQLIAEAVTRGSAHEATGLSFIDEYQVNGETIPSNIQALARAKFLTQIESKNAAAEWKRISNQPSADLQLLKSAFYAPPLKDDIEARRTILGKLKDVTSPEGLTFRLAEIRLMLDEDDSDRIAAAAALKLNEIIKETPTAVPPYSMMVEAYQRLKQPMQIAQLLQKAVDRGLNGPGLRLALAETLIQLNDAGKAIPHAVAVQQDVRASFLARQRAVQVMLDAKSYRLAVDSIKKDLPETCEDTDQHFAMFSTFALASLRANEKFDAAKLVGDLPGSNERWFQLWVELGTDENLPPTTEWLEAAKNWLDTNEFDRRRKLSRAYRKLANRGNMEERLRDSLALLTPVLESESATDVDLMSQAGIMDSMGETEKAISIYDRVSESADASIPLRSIAFNNSASLNLKKGDTAAAKARIQRALEIEKRPEFTDTLATILTAEGELEQATDLLSSAVEQQPEAILLRVRFADTLQQTGMLKAAEKQIQELKIRVRNAADTSLSIWQRIRTLEQTQYRLSAAQENEARTAG